jgi:hypothetical protein
MTHTKRNSNTERIRGFNPLSACVVVTHELTNLKIIETSNKIIVLGSICRKMSKRDGFE